MSSRGDRTHRCVRGALVSMVNDHGPITLDNLDSAVKRVVAQIRAEGNRILQVEGAGITEATEHLQKKLQKLKHGHDIALSQFERCRAERDALRQQVAEFRALCDPGENAVLVTSEEMAIRG